MFKSAAAVSEPAPAGVEPFEPLVPLSVLSLDLGEAPAEGWAAHLINRGVVVELDDIGRPAISRDDARLLITERRQAEERYKRLDALLADLPDGTEGEAK